MARYQTMEGAIRDFGQKIDLCTRIRDILAAYPDGSSVLKELLQNADDAGASEFQLLLDLRTHPSDALALPGTAGFYGPAILAFNNAVFTDTDLGTRAGTPRAQWTPRRLSTS